MAQQLKIGRDPGFKPCLSHCFLRLGTLLQFVSCISSPRCINGYGRYTAEWGGGGGPGDPGMD